jgi:hypothetical protein
MVDKIYGCGNSLREWEQNIREWEQIYSLKGTI